MDAQTCLKELEAVGPLSLATADKNGYPRLRMISAIHYDADAFYFFTARGKEMCRELMTDGRVSVMGYTKYREMIRFSGHAVPVPEADQKEWIDRIFEEQPYLSNVYPGNTRKIGIVFLIKDADFEYFNLGVHPIFRESYAWGGQGAAPQGYMISQKCIGCGACLSVCPQSCIIKGEPYAINSRHCLHCGACFERCPVKAVKRKE